MNKTFKIACGLLTLIGLIIIVNGGKAVGEGFDSGFGVMAVGTIITIIGTAAFLIFGTGKNRIQG